jgi:hypothetical protein
MNGLPPSKGGCLSRRALLSPEQRIRLLGIPVDQAGMARHYVLSAEDLALVRAKRRVSNRLGARDSARNATATGLPLCRGARPWRVVSP